MEFRKTALLAALHVNSFYSSHLHHKETLGQSYIGLHGCSTKLGNHFHFSHLVKSFTPLTLQATLDRAWEGQITFVIPEQPRIVMHLTTD